jgi:L-threonylcarbamoyladenylate synthase
MTARITTDVDAAAALLKSGGLVAFATETVYGLGANALDPQAVAGIFEAKGRPRFDPLIVHLPDAEQVRELVRDFPAAAARLAERFWPGPLTLVLPRRDRVPDIVTAGLPTVAVRVPRHPLALELLCRTGLPIAAPSANLFGYVSPTTAEHVAEQLGDRIDLILDGGPCQVGVESTVLLVAEAAPVLLRPGGVTREEIERVVGPIQVRTGRGPVDEEDAFPSPGMTARHYAPRTRLVLVDGLQDAPRGAQVGALTLRGVTDRAAYGLVEVLSLEGDLREAASKLFAALRRLDAAQLDCIAAERVPETGLGAAINDRLRRAAARDER